ncbi:MAG: MGMT family protein [Proteobacteria bacterium]|nr:MGMT family protein [Pseudomonadota bacterium]
MSVEIGSVYSRIYRCIKCIPEGKVATYGQIAKLIDASGARQVGYALSSTPADMNLPWHRVINAKGEISQRSDGKADSEQQTRLLAEGVVPNKHGQIDLLQYRWQPSFEDFLHDMADDDEFWRDQPGIG